MGKPQNGKKNYNYKKGKGKFKTDKYRQKNKFNRNKPKNKYLVVKKNIERNKESEELLKRSQLAEIKYQKSFVKPDSSEDENEAEPEQDAFEQLLGSLNKSKKESAIESSSDDSEIEVEQEENEEEEENEESDEELEGSEEESEKEKGGSDDSEEENGKIEESEDENGGGEESEGIEDESGGENENSDEENGKLEESDEESEENQESEEEEDSKDPEETVLDSDDESDHENSNKSKNFKPEESNYSGIDFLDDSIAHELQTVEEDLEEEFDSDVENEDKELSENQSILDPFCVHFNNDLSPSLLEAVSAVPQQTEKTKAKWKTLDNILIEIPHSAINEPKSKKKKTILGDEEVFASEGKVPEILDPSSLCKKSWIKEQISKNIESLTPLQTEILSVANNYQDFYYPHRNFDNGEDIRQTYCIHALNHVLKTRSKILHHNAKLGKLKGKKDPTVPEICRDQGLVRPKVLIVLPFRDSAFKVVNLLIDLLNPNEKNAAMNYKRFVEEFSGQTLYFPKKNPKPEDYEQTFAGNTEDTFRIGISLNKKSMKLYSPFYASDILIASPLGLRLIIGAKGDHEREYDFLASVELLILDQMELFLAQNWDHLLHMFDHLHLQPQSRQNTDFSRVRSWCLNGWSHFYRQTLLFSSFDLAEFRALFNNRCHNYRGKIRTANPCNSGTIRHVTVQVPQIFHRIEVKSIETSFDTRFEYFTNTILPQFKPAIMAHCMIYIPSYFDFVRVRNYFKKEELNFVQICEYTKDNKISKARTLFYHGGAHFMLYSERGHFFRRTRIKGIRHLIMYQPPTWSHFYPEMINLMQEINQNPQDNVVGNAMTVTVLYTKYDLLQLQSIVTTEQTGKMMQSNKQTHMFMKE